MPSQSEPIITPARALCLEILRNQFVRAKAILRKVRFSICVLLGKMPPANDTPTLPADAAAHKIDAVATGSEAQCHCYYGWKVGRCSGCPTPRVASAHAVAALTARALACSKLAHRSGRANE